MDRGDWWATVHKVAESDITEATEHTWKEKPEDKLQASGATGIAQPRVDRPVTRTCRRLKSLRPRPCLPQNCTV